jgi:hypothetical protein
MDVKKMCHSSDVDLECKAEEEAQRAAKQREKELRAGGQARHPSDRSSSF